MEMEHEPFQQEQYEGLARTDSIESPQTASEEHPNTKEAGRIDGATIEGMRRLLENEPERFLGFLRGDQAQPEVLMMLAERMHLRDGKVYFTVTTYPRRGPEGSASLRMWSTRPEILSNGHPNRNYNLIATSVWEKTAIEENLAQLANRMKLVVSDEVSPRSASANLDHIVTTLYVFEAKDFASSD